MKQKTALTKATYSALSQNYRWLVAAAVPANEYLVGKAIKSGEIDRQDLVVASKLGFYKGSPIGAECMH